jgi:hypothetical protein
MNPYNANVTLSVRPFPFTLPNVLSPISGPQLFISNGDKHTVNSPNEIYLPMSSMLCYQSAPAASTQMAAFLCGQSSS